VNSLAQPNTTYLEIERIKQRIYAQVNPDLERIEAEISRHLTTSVPLVAVVGRHIMASGGKRLRPLLMILAARLCGYRGNHDATLAIVFEYLHAATLLHDDVVDNAEFRRNNPAANIMWGNPAVVLVGDFLYSKSILLTVGYNNIRILQVLSEATTKMAEGEVLQLINADNLELDEREYLEVIVRKTAVLISAACQVGAIFGGASAAQEEVLRAYGHHLGIAFQLVDDALDFTGKREELGKSIGNDVQEGKATLPLIHAMHHSAPEEKEQIRKIFSAEKILPRDFERVRDLVIRTGGIDRTTRLATQHVEQAKEGLQIFPDSPTRDILLDIADYVVYRRI
jgi:octaprenyl-diphosphate synthase